MEANKNIINEQIEQPTQFTCQTNLFPQVTLLHLLGKYFQ